MCASTSKRPELASPLSSFKAVRGLAVVQAGLLIQRNQNIFVEMARVTVGGEAVSLHDAGREEADQESTTGLRADRRDRRTHGSQALTSPAEEKRG